MVKSEIYADILQNLQKVSFHYNLAYRAWKSTPSNISESELDDDFSEILEEEIKQDMDILLPGVFAELTKARAEELSSFANLLTDIEKYLSDNRGKWLN